MKLDQKDAMFFYLILIQKKLQIYFQINLWKINKIKANRSINSNSTKRTGHFELLIKNY